MGSLHLAVLLGHGHGDELMVDAQRAEGFLKGVGPLHLREEDIGGLHAVVGPDLLDRERKGVLEAVEELHAGLGGELRA